MAESAPSALAAVDVTVRFGGVIANDEVSIAVRSKEAVGLIGPNGAGKTTLFNVLAGTIAPTAGKVWLEGIEVTDLPARLRCRRGIIRTFQNVRLFASMSVLENVMVAPLGVRGLRLNEAREAAREALEFVDFKWPMTTIAGQLPIVEQRRVELARALAAVPRFLLLDEVMSGLSPEDRKLAIALLMKIREHRSVGLLIVEHLMDVLVGTCDRMLVLQSGRVIGEGMPDEVLRRREVVVAYLGSRWGRRAAGEA